MTRQIPLSTPNLSMNIVENLKECIETGWVSTGGRFITEFEEKVASYVGMEEAVSTQSGTAGLHLALRALEVGAGDEVIVPTLTFVAAVAPVLYVGAHPVFMDCDGSLCMDIDKVERFLEDECIVKIDRSDDKKSNNDTEQQENKGFDNDNLIIVNRKTGRRVRGVIPVHIFGNMCQMVKLMDIAKKYGLWVIEDATEALGSRYMDHTDNGVFAGKFAGTLGHIGVYSFNANKIITTGGGGMVVSHNKFYIDKIRHLSITAKTDSLYFIHDEVGYNYRMLNLQAALGVSQIDELEKFIEIKKCNYDHYKSLLEEAPQVAQSQKNGIVRLLPFNDTVRANYWFYSLLINQSQSWRTSRDSLMESLIQKGIQCRPIWKLIHTLEPYKKFQSYQIEKAPYYESHILNVPCSTNLTKEDIKYICDLIDKAL